MTDIYMEQNGSKKKLLVPLIVLLLCAVSLTGAGYAYNSTVTNVDDNVHIEGLTLDLKTAGENPVPVTSAIYNLSFGYSDHITAGKAINGLTGKGFKTVGETQTAVDVDISSSEARDACASGYYMETIYDSEAVGYCVAPTEINAANLATAAGTSSTTGVFALGTYTLTVVNATGSNVGVTAKAVFENDSPDFGKGVKGIYAVVTGTIGGQDIETVFDITEGNGAERSKLLANFAPNQSDSTDLTIKTYVVCSDYYSETLPEVETVEYGFRLIFIAGTQA